MNKVLAFLLFSAVAASAQVINPGGGPGGGSAAIACIGTPGNTTGSYRQQCQTTGGAIYACNNAAGCTVAADWVSVTGSGSFVYPAGTGFTVVAAGAAWGTTLADPLTGAHGGSGVNNGSNTLTMAGSVVFSGAFNPTFVIPSTGSWTFPAPGTLVNNAVTTLSSLTAAAGGSFGTAAFVNTGTSGGTVPLLNAANTFSGNAVFSARFDASGSTHSLPALTGLTASKPATCSVGEEYFASDATAGQNMFYCTASNTWTQQLNSGGGSSAFNSITSGTNTTAAMLVGTGGSLGVTGSGTIAATTAVNLSSYPTLCSGSQFSQGLSSGSNNCATPSGSGNVSNSGTPTIHQLAVWVNSTSILGVGPGTANAPLLSGGASVDPAYSAILYPTSATANNLIYASSSTQLASLATCASGVWITNGSSVPSCSTTLPSGVAATNMALTTPNLGTPSAGTLTSTTGYLWNNLANAGGALTLANAGNATTFNQTSAVNWTWANTTAAIVSASQSSPIINLLGTEWHASASAAGGMTAQFVPGTGTDAASTVNFAHTGSATGAMTYNFSGPVSITGNGSNPSIIQLIGNTTPWATVANNAGIMGPNGTTFTGYWLQLSATGPAAAGVALIGAPSSGVSQVTYGVATAAVGGTGVSNTAMLTLGSSNQNWATLGTGIVKNTTTTGALTNAASGDVIGLWTGTCSSSTFLRGDGSCQTPTGSGTVNAGTTGHLGFYASSTSAISDMGADFTFSTHTLSGAATAIFDMSAASVTAGLKIPVGAGASPTVDGQIAFNSTTHRPSWGGNGATLSAVMVADFAALSTGPVCNTTGTGALSIVSLTTTGSSGASTLSGCALNIPQYTGGGGGSSVPAVGPEVVNIPDASNAAANIITRLPGITQVSALNTTINCASGASPAVCTSAPSGAVAIPAGVNSTVVVQTTAVTASSRIVLTLDDSLTLSATTCNTTAATLAVPPYISARTAGTSFTISYLGTITANPVCLSYQIVN